MAGSPSWSGWLSRLLSGLQAWLPIEPGSHAARLEERRVGALLDQELRKRPGQRDEELVHTLRVKYCTMQLRNVQMRADTFAYTSNCLEEPVAHECCAAAGWARQRLAASYRALHDYYCQNIQQIREELAAAEARRPVIIAARPSLRLNLPEALQQAPPRLDMCSACARQLEQAKLAEQSCQVQADFLQKQFQKRHMQAAPAVAAGSRGTPGAPRAAAPAEPAASLPAGEAQQAQQGPQQQYTGSLGVGCAEGAPDTPKQLPPALQQQHSTASEQGQEEQERDQEQQLASLDQDQGGSQRQEWDAADERRLLLPKAAA